MKREFTFAVIIAALLVTRTASTRPGVTK
jgi:hypothetical protein